MDRNRPKSHVEMGLLDPRCRDLFNRKHFRTAEVTQPSARSVIDCATQARRHFLDRDTLHEEAGRIGITNGYLDASLSRVATKE